MSERTHDTVRVPLPAGGALQVYTSYTGEPNDWAAIYVHGFGSTRFGQKAEALEAACAQRGWTYASFDFRGHGQSTGSLLELRGSLLLEDLEAIRDYLVSRGIPKLALFGSSMGGWAAAWFAARHPHSVVGAALLAPAFNLLRNRWEQLAEPERERWRRTGRLRVQNEWVDAEIGFGLVEEIEEFRIERLASELARPLLIFHGMQDDVVPVGDTLAFVQRASFPEIELRLYKAGDHRLLDYREAIADAACTFFGRLVQRTANADD